MLNVKINIKVIKIPWETYENLTITAKYWFWWMNKICFVWSDLENIIRLIVWCNLMYMWDKSQYRFMGRTRTINF